MSSGPPTVGPTTPALLERGTETAAIAEAVGHLGAGRGGVLQLSGPAGIGKSTLLQTCHELAENQHGLTVLGHAGVPNESHHTYAAVVGLLGEEVRRRLRDGAARTFTGAARLALPLFETGAFDSGPGRSGEFPLLHGLHWLCADLCDDRPLLLLADDVQWYDEPSLRALAYLAERAGDLPLLVVLAQRSGEGTVGPALQDLARNARVLEPQPLSAAAVALLADATRDDGRCPPDVVDKVLRRSGGNPLLVRELLRLHAENPQAPLDRVTPDSVVTTTALRLRTVSATARALAEMAAVLGKETGLPVLAAALGCAPAAASRAADELVGRDLLTADSRIGFRHPLLRDAVLAGITPLRRTELALCGARAVQVSDRTRAAALLVDSSAAAPVGEDWVVATLIGAAETARRRAGADEARRCLQRCLLESLDRPREREVRHLLGIVLDEAGDLGAIEQLTRAAELCETPAELAEVTLSLADALFHFAMLPESAAAARDAMEALDAVDHAELRLALEATALNAEALVGTNRERPSALAASVACATTPGQRAVLAHVAWDAAATGLRPHDEVSALARRAIGDATLTAEVGAASPVFVYAGTALAWAGDYAAARSHAETGIRHATEIGSLVGVAYATSLRAGVAVYQGDITQAEADAGRVLDELADADPMCFAITLGWAIEVGIEREDVAAAQVLLTAAGLDGEVPDFGTLDTMLLSRARLRAHLGDLDGALADLAEVGRRSQRSGYLSAACSPWRSMSAFVLADRGDLGGGRELAEEELALARSFGAPRAIGHAMRALAACQQPDEAVPHLREAVAVLTGSDADLQLAEAMVELGRHESAGSLDERRRLLRDAMTTAHSCGSPRVVNRALSALRATGARPRRPAHRGIDALTAQERRAVGLAVGGLSNREIAETMFLTRRTVELHLSNAYRKLGVDGRADLEGALRAP